MGAAQLPPLVWLGEGDELEGEPSGGILHGKDLLSLSILCNAIVLLDIPPPPSLLALLQDLDLSSMQSSTLRAERRAATKMQDALRRWVRDGSDGEPLSAVPLPRTHGELPVPRTAGRRGVGGARSCERCEKGRERTLLFSVMAAWGGDDGHNVGQCYTCRV